MSLIEHFAELALADPDPVARPKGRSLVSAHPDDLVLDAAPIEPSWVISGAPQARAKLHSESADGLASTTIWGCTAGAFRWNFVWDETVVILEGGVRVTDETGRVTTLGAGDVAFFAAGAWATWEIETHVRKIAFCRKAFPKPVLIAMALKTWLSSLLRRGGAADAGFGRLQAQPALTARG